MRRGRFAPSPTGWLHLGHVANAAWTWEAARSHGAGVILRMEDHDRGRCRPEYERQIYDDLVWLGLVPDPESLGSLLAGSPSPWRQSDCTAVYEAALDRLVREGLVYGCDCGLFDARRLAWLRPGAGLVNLARGAQVVETHLVAALDAGRLRHAVLDVFAEEPLPPSHPCWRHPRVTVLPHAAALTDPRSAARVAAYNLRALAAGRPLAHLADRARGY